MRDPARAPIVRDALLAVVDAVYPTLAAGVSAVDAVRHACRLLEDDPNFNAGTGACMQVDGKIRLSASIMDGGRQSFSGVINGDRIRNPIELASYLQTQDDRVLAAEGVDELCRQLGIEIWDNVTERRLGVWLAERRGDFKRLEHELETGITKGMMSFEHCMKIREYEGFRSTVPPKTGYSEHEVAEYLHNEKVIENPNALPR